MVLPQKSLKSQDKTYKITFIWDSKKKGMTKFYHVRFNETPVSRHYTTIIYQGYSAHNVVHLLRYQGISLLLGVVKTH